MLKDILANPAALVLVASGLVSEIIAIRQVLKYPDNDGFGGILAGALKFLSNFGKPSA